MTSPSQNGPRRSQRAPKPPARGQAYRNTLAPGVTAQTLQNAQSLPSTRGYTQRNAPNAPQNTSSANGPVTRSQKRGQPTLPRQINAATSTTNGQQPTSGAVSSTSNATHIPRGGSSSSVPPNPSTPPQLRRSQRNQGKSAPVNPRRQLPIKRPRVSKIKIDGLMIKIYEEIRQWGITRRKNQTELSIIKSFLYEVRMCRFFDLAPDDARDDLEQELRNYDMQDPTRGGVIRRTRDELDVLDRSRVRDFCTESNLFLLTICAHSPSFREVFVHSDIESQRNGEPGWSDVEPIIHSCRSSLELFASCYDYSWTMNLVVGQNKDFKTLLDEVYNGDMADVTPDTFGIGPSEPVSIHQIPDEPEGHTHHHWALPVEDLQPAARTSIKYTVTEHTSQPPFTNDYYAVFPDVRPRPEGRGGAASTVNAIGSKQTLLQLDTSESKLLEGKPWPAGAYANAHEAPNFCGREGNPCKACDKEAVATIVIGGDQKARPFQVDEVDEEGIGCRCTFEDYTAHENANRPPFHDPSKVLVELYTTKTIGRGVRSLQAIPANTCIGNYVGEIYPELDAQNEEITRYGQPEGNIYHFDVSIGLYQEEDMPAEEDRTSLRYFTIDSAHIGNWTRYMNHSCNSNVAFETINIGQQWTVICRTRRAIKFGDVMTADYGREYFVHRELNCKCGEKRCRYKNVVSATKKGKRKRDDDESDDRGRNQGANKKVKKTMPVQTARKTTSKAAKKGAGRRK